MTEIPLQRLKDFLVRAKQATYAGGGAYSEPCRPGARDLRYEEPEHGFAYLDTFFGRTQFIGEEAVWLADQPVWALNYAGHITGPGYDGDFLKAALRAVPEDAPFRGPIEFQQGSLLYVNTYAGDLGWFFGREEIYKSGVSIYECVYHGGAVM